MEEFVLEGPRISSRFQGLGGKVETEWAERTPIRMRKVFHVEHSYKSASGVPSSGPGTFLSGFPRGSRGSYNAEASDSIAQPSRPDDNDRLSFRPPSSDDSRG